MDEQIFTPKHKNNFYVAWFSLIIIEGLLILMVFMENPIPAEIIFIGLFIAFLILWLPSGYFTRIRFGSQVFILERVLWPPKVIPYQDVTDIGHMLVRTRRGKIGLIDLTNSDELTDIFQACVADGRIQSGQLEHRQAAHEATEQKVILPAGIVTILIWLASFVIWPYDGSLVRKLSVIVIFVPTYGLVYKFVKNRSEN